MTTSKLRTSRGGRGGAEEGEGVGGGDGAGAEVVRRAAGIACQAAAGGDARCLVAAAAARAARAPASDRMDEEAGAWFGVCGRCREGGERGRKNERAALDQVEGGGRRAERARTPFPLISCSPGPRTHTRRVRLSRADTARYTQYHTYTTKELTHTHLHAQAAPPTLSSNTPPLISFLITSPPPTAAPHRPAPPPASPPCWRGRGPPHWRPGGPEWRPPRCRPAGRTAPGPTRRARTWPPRRRRWPSGPGPPGCGPGRRGRGPGTPGWRRTGPGSRWRRGRTGRRWAGRPSCTLPRKDRGRGRRRAGR